MKCKCDMRTKLVGDGCEYCNPQLAADYKAENEGAEAYYHGVERVACPYTDSRDKASWLIGWDDAHEEVRSS